jgi:hypothetical protein
MPFEGFIMSINWVMLQSCWLSSRLNMATFDQIEFLFPGRNALRKPYWRSLGISACRTAQRQVTKPIFGNISDWKAP